MALPFNLLEQVTVGLVLLAGLVCDAALFVRFLPASQLRIQRKPWGLRQLWQAAAAVLGLMLLSNVAYVLIAKVADTDLEEMMPVILPIEILVRLVILASFGIFFRLHRVAISQALGLGSTRPRTAVGLGVAFGLASLPPVGAIMFATDGFCRLFGIQPTEQPITELFMNTNSRLVLTSVTLFALIIAPVFEEFLFRGFAYPALKARLGSVSALVIVSAAFAGSHFHGPSFLPLFVLALGLGLAYELTGTLLTPIIMHAVFNSTMIIQLFYQRAHP
jgi:uncharacterized protein